MSAFASFLLAELARERGRLALLVSIMADAPHASCADALAAFVEEAFREQ